MFSFIFQKHYMLVYKVIPFTFWIQNDLIQEEKVYINLILLLDLWSVHINRRTPEAKKKKKKIVIRYVLLISR